MPVATKRGAGLWSVLTLLFLLTPSPGSFAQNPNGDELVAADTPAARRAPGSLTRFAPSILPTLRLHRRDGAISLDGRMDDAGWATAASVSNFTEFQPTEGAKPPIDIRTRIAYDENTLFVAFEVLDDPKAIRANYSGRDQIWNDDYVGIILDPVGDGQALYFLGVNPYGIQGDSRIQANGNEDEGFDMVWESVGRITDQGYVVEMAIPFRSLRFPNKAEHEWRATFWITHPRASRSQYSWAAISRDNSCWPCQFGTLQGIENVRSGRNIEAIPTLVGAQAGALRDEEDPKSGFDNGRIRLEPSLDLKYGIRSDLTAELTLNPDFSQIESDAAQVDVNTTFALFYPERRPFFQEGADLFSSHLETMYTRSINNPLFAAKLSGRVGSTSLAFLSARDSNTPLLLPFEERSELVEAGKSTSTVLRLRRAFPDNSYMGALVTDRRLDQGGSGSTAGVDGLLRVGRTLSLQGQFVASATSELNDPSLSAGFADLQFDRGAHTAALDGESYSGHAFHVGINREARHWMFGARYRQFSPTFRADNGFIRQNDLRNVQLWQGIAIYPRGIHFIDRILPNVAVWRSWNFDNLQKRQGLDIEANFQMKAQTFAFVGYELMEERFKDVDFSGLYRFSGAASSNFSPRAGLHLFLERGIDISRNEEAPEKGRSLTVQTTVNLRPTDRLLVAPSFTYAELRNRDTGDAFFSGFILRTRLNYQATRALTLRTIVQYNDFSEQLEIDPLLTYRINPFTVFHIGSTHDLKDLASDQPDETNVFRQTARQFFFKFQYLVQG